MNINQITHIVNLPKIPRKEFNSLGKFNVDFSFDSPIKTNIELGGVFNFINRIQV